MNISQAQAYRKRSNFRQHILELCLTVAVCLLLYWAAQPLGMIADSALGRYERLPLPRLGQAWWPTAMTIELPSWKLIDRSTRAPLWLGHAGYALAATVAFGWFALQAARVRAAWSAGFVVFAFAVAALWAVPFGVPPATCVVVAAIGFVYGIGGWWHRRHAGQARIAAPASISAALIWPMWCGLAGAGVLWITGFAAHGPLAASAHGAPPPGARFMGIQQADAFFLGSVVLCVATLKAPSLMRLTAATLNALGQAMRRPRLAFVCILGGVLGAVTLAWVGHPKLTRLAILPITGLGMPHISGEALRIVFLTTMSWVIYRYGEWLSSTRRVVMACLVAVGGIVLCVAALGLSGDAGPIQVLGLALSLLLSTAIVAKLVRALAHRDVTRNPLLALSVSSIVVVGVVTATLAQIHYAPRFSSTGAEREFAFYHPFGATSANFAQILWLIDAATHTDGFGLARVPFCGARAYVGVGACSLTSGSMIQLPEDFAVTGLVATWGKRNALLLLLLLVTWLYCMARTVHLAAGPPVMRLQAWLVTLACISLATQTLISAGGTIGISLVSAVALPVFGYGSVSLIVTAACAGLALGCQVVPANRSAGNPATSIFLTHTTGVWT